MQIVFVHGVNVRDDDGKKPNYKQSVDLRDGYFRAWLEPASDRKLRIYNPYWGGAGVTFAWDLRSLPRSRYERFGGTTLQLRSLLDEIAPEAAQSHVVLSIARRSLAQAVDVLWAFAAFVDTGADLQMVSMAGKMASDYARENPRPNWVVEAHDDREFVDGLLAAVPAETPRLERFGSGPIRNVIVAAANAVRAAERVPVDLARAWQNERISRFIGDVVQYFKDRGRLRESAPIVKIVADSLRLAASTRENDGPLIVIAHSMGGPIAYDVLTKFAPDVVCDVFVTVGSQVGLFEEMKQFEVSDPAIPDERRSRVERPANILRWINIFDPLDVLAYGAGAVFEGVNDTIFPYSTNPFTAHESYFLLPEFYRRLAERMEAA